MGCSLAYLLMYLFDVLIEKPADNMYMHVEFLINTTFLLDILMHKLRVLKNVFKS